MTMEELERRIVLEMTERRAKATDRIIEVTERRARTMDSPRDDGWKN
ncbi:hypothetical protein ACIQXF_05230 [Lysinibacillus sp. NPDC097231]